MRGVDHIGGDDQIVVDEIRRAACRWRRCRRPWPPPETPPADACSANQPNTAAWSRRSTSLRPTVSSSTSSRASRRTSAAPTMPRCPATKTVLPFSSNGVLAIGDLPPRDREIARHHLLDQLGKARLRLPAELLARLAGVADQFVDFGRAEIGRIDANQRSCRISCRRRFPRRPCRAIRCCGRLRRTPVRRIRAPSGSRRSPARNRRAASACRIMCMPST